jgi:threonine synthase
MSRGVLETYKEFLPITDRTPLLTLGEGNTPLISAPRLASRVGCKDLFFKLEGCNPTGSFKDRGMVVAVAKAAEGGASRIICASTGNTSAAAAAYGARFGLATFVVIPSGYIAAGKLAQAVMYGARVLAINGNFDQALEIVRHIVTVEPIALVNSLNPHRLEGQKTAAFEVVDELGEAPDILCIPVGNAGNISAYWMGFKEYAKAGKSSLPRMAGFEAEGAAPIVRGEPVLEPETVASAIRIGNPASWRLAEEARDESKGLIDTVTDQEILAAYRAMAEDEGIFGEPASAAPYAGLTKLARTGYDLTGKRVVCVVTGTGLKDPDTAMSEPQRITELPANLEAVAAALRSH